MFHKSKESFAVRISSLRPHHHGTIVAFGAMFGLVCVAVSQTTVASASNSAATQPVSSMMSETGAVLAGQQSTPPLPSGPITADSGRDLISALQIRLRWVASLNSGPTGSFDPETTAAIKHFQEKQRLKQTGLADAKTVSRLIATARDGFIDPRCTGEGITLCVDKTQKVTRYIKDGVVIRALDTNFGPEKGDPKFGQYSRTREGVNPIASKERLSVSSSYGYQMPYWMGFDGGIGFHYSKYFHQVGYKDTSMGCTILRDEAGAKWLFENTPKGTKVVVYH